MADTWPLISVCILSFNRFEYLKKCLESFRASCSYPNLQYVAVDNGSTRDVVDFLKSLDFIHTIVFNRENMGMGYAMNQVRETADGEYFFNLENDWYFFYRSDWMERGVLLFERDRRGEYVRKKPETLPLGLVKYKVGAGIGSYTNNPSLMSRIAYDDVGKYPQYGTEYKYVSEDVHRVESHYIKMFRQKYSCALSETPCAVHIGGNTTNPNYGNRGRLKYEELDERLRGKWKDGKWHITYHYMKLWNRMKIRKTLKKNEEFERRRMR